MTEEQKKAYKWALNQQYQSVAASYARALAEYIRDSRHPQPLTQADVDKMHFEIVWISYGDGTADGEWGIVIFGRLYSIDVLEGAGLQDMLDDLMCGESLDRPSGQYVVYRTKPEPPDGVQTTKN